MVKITGKETPRELRQALIDCGEMMTKMFLEANQGKEKIERFLLVRELQVDILVKMAKDDPCADPPARADLLS